MRINTGLNDVKFFFSYICASSNYRLVEFMLFLIRVHKSIRYYVCEYKSVKNRHNS